MGFGKVDEEVAIIDILERFGWTYQEYLSQPHWVIKAIYLKTKLDNEYKRQQEKNGK